MCSKLFFGNQVRPFPLVFHTLLPNEFFGKPPKLLPWIPLSLFLSIYSTINVGKYGNILLLIGTQSI